MLSVWLGRSLGVSLGAAIFASPVTAGLVAFDRSAITVQPGGSFSMLVLLSDVTTPVRGYSLVAGVIASAGLNTGEATGRVSANVASTNLFTARNLITGGGGAFDPFFSTIQPSAPDGVFVNALSLGGSTFLPTPGTNDVLAQIFFNVSADASGEFMLGFRAGTALADSRGNPIPFMSRPTRVLIDSVQAVPLPHAAWAGAIGLAGVAGLGAWRRRRALDMVC